MSWQENAFCPELYETLTEMQWYDYILNLCVLSNTPKTICLGQEKNI